MKNMENNKPCKSTPQGTLLEQIMDTNQPKSEREWAASREIVQLREQLAALRQENEWLREAFIKFINDVFDNKYEADKLWIYCDRARKTFFSPKEASDGR